LTLSLQKTRLAKPLSLRHRIRGEVEDNADILRQDGADDRRHRVLDPCRMRHVALDVGDRFREQSPQEVVLDEEHRVVPTRQLARERRFAGRHLSAQEHQSCRMGHRRERILAFRSA
jgi:hypothetical protein